MGGKVVTLHFSPRPLVFFSQRGFKLKRNSGFFSLAVIRLISFTSLVERKHPFLPPPLVNIGNSILFKGGLFWNCLFLTSNHETQYVLKLLLALLLKIHFVFAECPEQIVDQERQGCQCWWHPGCRCLCWGGYHQVSFNCKMASHAIDWLLCPSWGYFCVSF